jgi:hypothetical protein
MTRNIADPTFGIGAQSLAVLALLSHIEPNWASYNEKYHDYEVEFETKTWYNGRERGILISMSHSIGSKALHFAIFEHRNSDQLCVLKWEYKSFYWNSPDAQNAIEDAYGEGKTKWDVSAKFGCNQIGECVNWIEKEMEDWYLKNKPEPVDSKEEVKI